MPFLSNTGVIEAILTERGKELLATTGKLGIDRVSFSDDEIDYNLSESSLTALTLFSPIIHARSIQNNLITLAKGTLAISVIQLSPPSITMSGTGTVQINIVTLNGNDTTNGYTVKTTTNNIILASLPDKFKIQRNQAIDSDENTIRNAFISGDINTQILTVENSFLIKSRNIAGTYTVQVIGNNTGASEELTITISAIDYGEFIRRVNPIDTFD